MSQSPPSSHKYPRKTQLCRLNFVYEKEAQPYDFR